MSNDVVIIEDNKVFLVYKSLQTSLSKYGGRNITFPTKTDPKKTYNWRYFMNFIDKMEQLEIEEKYWPKIIDAIVSYAKRRNLLSRGVAVLHKSDIIDLCVKRLERDQDRYSQMLSSIQNSHQFIQEKLNSGESIVKLLLKRKHKDSYPNLVCWFEQGYIVSEYIAISKACLQCAQSMYEEEQSILGDGMKLLKLRWSILGDDETRIKLKKLLKDDLIED